MTKKTLSTINRYGLFRINEVKELKKRPTFIAVKKICKHKGERKKNILCM